MTTILLFPGQGSQAIGMGKDLYEKALVAQRRYAEAAEILGFDLARICFEGPEDELRQTRVTQPALYVHSCIISELLAEAGIQGSAAAGHSLGEYSALTCAGSLSFEDGLRLVKIRAEAMQSAGEKNPGTMAAIVGLDDAAISKLCEDASSAGVVIPANYNSPGQVVISGSVAGVEKAISLAKPAGAKLAKQLVVSGAFHSPLMKPASEELEKALSTSNIRMPRFPVISNVTAKPHTDVESIRKLLAEQLLSPVRWTETLHALALFGDVRWLEVGSGNVLAGLLKRTLSGATAETVGKVDDLERVAATTGFVA